MTISVLRGTMRNTAVCIARENIFQKKKKSNSVTFQIQFVKGPRTKFSGHNTKTGARWFQVVITERKHSSQFSISIYIYNGLVPIVYGSTNIESFLAYLHLYIRK